MLLIQPYLSLREPQKLKGTEKAVYNYYMYRTEHHPVDTFMYWLHEKARKRFTENDSVITMDAVHFWDDWVFVDYCHLTRQANRQISYELSQHIVSSGKYRPFQIIETR